MALHPQFPISPYAPLVPEQRWFPADEALRSTAYEKLLPPLVAKVRNEVHTWRNQGYPGASATSVALLRHWFETEHRTENADGSLSTFRYYFTQREAVETVIWLYEVRRARAKYDLLRFDASGAVSSGGFELRFAAFLEEAPDVQAFAKNYLAIGFKLDYVKSNGDLSNYTPDFIVRTKDLKIWIIETKGSAELDLPQKMARLKQWCSDATDAEESGQRYDFAFVDQNGFEKHAPKTFASLAASFTEYHL